MCNCTALLQLFRETERGRASVVIPCRSWCWAPKQQPRHPRQLTRHNALNSLLFITRCGSEFRLRPVRHGREVPARPIRGGRLCRHRHKRTLLTPHSSCGLCRTTSPVSPGDSRSPLPHRCTRLETTEKVSEWRHPSVPQMTPTELERSSAADSFLKGPLEVMDQPNYLNSSIIVITPLRSHSHGLTIPRRMLLDRRCASSESSI